MMPVKEIRKESLLSSYIYRAHKHIFLHSCEKFNIRIWQKNSFARIRGIENKL